MAQAHQGQTDSSANPERETRILDAAAQLISHYGYDKTTVSDIARAAGVSKGAIYLHFDSKDALFEALLLRELQSYQERWLERIEADPKGGTFAGMYKQTLYTMKDNTFMMALFTQDRRVLGNYLRKSDNIFANRGATRTDFVQMMQDAGALRTDLSANVIAHIMNMLAFGLVGMTDVNLPDAEPPLDDLIEGIGWLLDAALTPDDPAAQEAGKQVLRQLAATMRDYLQQPRTDQP